MVLDNQNNDCKSVSGVMVKPLSIIVVILFVTLFLAVSLPIIARLNTAKAQSLPVSVTALSSVSMLGQAADTLASEAGAVVGIYSQPAPARQNPVGGNEISDYPGLDEFSLKLADGRSDNVVGIYVPGIFALPVEQQPAGMPDFVAREHNMLTQFALPKEYGSIGILAHNYLSGSRFGQLAVNTEIMVVFGNGQVTRYRVARVEEFQALKPNSPFSEFVDASSSSGRVLTSGDLFKRVYTTNRQLVFQTCIEAQGESSWGRMFVIATPVEQLNLSVPGLNPAGLN